MLTFVIVYVVLGLLLAIVDVLGKVLHNPNYRVTDVLIYFVLNMLFGPVVAMSAIVIGGGSYVAGFVVAKIVIAYNAGYKQGNQ